VKTYRVTTASDSTHDILTPDGSVVAEYLPDVEAVIAAVADEAMTVPVRLSAREAFLLEALAPFGTVTADRQHVLI
jgi:hypothetical protein